MGRYIRIVINGEPIPDGTRISFELYKPSTSEKVDGRVRIWNIESDISSNIVTDDVIDIYAGESEEEQGLVFSGAVERVVVDNRAEDGKLVKLLISDHAHSTRRLTFVSGRSYMGSVSSRLVFADFIGDLGLRSYNLDAIPASHNLVDFSYSGRTLDGLTSVASQAGCVWYDSNGQIRVRPIGQSYQTDVKLTVLGQPLDQSLTNEGAYVTVRLNYLCKRGQQVNVDGVDVTGIWFVSSVEHDADNWEGSFETRLVLRR